MIIAFSFITLALLIKDTVPIGDVYVLRTLSQGTAFIIGLWWLFTQGGVEALRKYWLLGAYIVVLSGTVFVSNDAMRVALQVISLLAVSLFFVSFSERAAREPITHLQVLRIVMCALLLVCVGSLILYKIAPTLAYDQTVERLAWDNVHRFKGLFGKPAGIAAVSGILLGLCVFTRVHWVIRGLGAVAALLCLYLTLSRSFWVGAFVALMVTGAFYIPRKRVLVVMGVLGLILGIGVVSLMGTKVPAMEESKVLRSDSLENLSGRTTVWSLAIDRFWDRPVLGYGYTAGHHALLQSKGKDDGEISIEQVGLFQNENFSFHSGYVQALVDSGILGAFFYVMIMVVSIWQMIRYDSERQYPGILYCLVFLSISNLGETIVFSPATFQSAFYWYAATVALGLGSPRPQPDSVEEPVVAASPEFGHTRYPLLCRPDH